MLQNTNGGKAPTEQAAPEATSPVQAAPPAEELKAGLIRIKSAEPSGSVAPSEPEPVVQEVQEGATAKSPVSHDDVDAGLRRIKSDIMVREEYFSQQDSNKDPNLDLGDVRSEKGKKRKSLMRAVKSSLKRKSRRPDAEGSPASDAESEQNPVHKSRSEPTIHKHTTV